MRKEDKDSKIQRYLQEIMSRSRNSSITHNNTNNDINVYNDVSYDQRESIYKDIVDSVVDIKSYKILHDNTNKQYSEDSHIHNIHKGNSMTQESDDVSIDGILKKLYNIIMKESNPSEIEVIVQLIRFYQDYIKKLQTDIERLEKEKSFNDQYRKDTEYQISLYKQQMVNQDRDNRDNDMSIDMKSRYESMIQQYKSMIDTLYKDIDQYKNNEISLLDRYSKMKVDHDAIMDDMNRMKRDMIEKDMKNKESSVEVDRLNTIYSNISHKYTLLLKDYDILNTKYNTLDYKYNNIMSNSSNNVHEIDLLKNNNNMLKKSTEQLIDEVCKYKYIIKQIEHDHHIDANLYTNNQAPRPLSSQKDNMSSKSTIYKSHDDHRKHTSQLLEKDHINTHNTYDHEVSPSISNENNKYMMKNITTFPAHKNIEMNKYRIDELNVQLYKEQENKNMIEAQLCKLPDRPKKVSDKDKKKILEDDLDDSIRKISELKKQLKDMSIF